MKKGISTQNFWHVSKDQAWEILGRRGLKHTYGECSSVCDLLEKDTGSSIGHQLFEIGLIDMKDLELNGNNITFKDVIEASEKKGYIKIVPSDVINYIDQVKDYMFGSQTAIMSLMNEVADGDGIPGRIYLQPDEDGYLVGLGFFQVDETKSLSETAKFLVAQKIKE